MKIKATLGSLECPCLKIKVSMEDRKEIRGGGLI